MIRETPSVPCTENLIALIAALRAENESLKARIAELERKIGKQQMDLDFFREALRLIDARDRSSRATPSTRSLKK